MNRLPILLALLLAVSIRADAAVGTREEPVPGDGRQSANHTEVLDPFGRRVLADEFGRFARNVILDPPAFPAPSPSAPSAELTASAWEFVGPEGGNVVDIAVSPTQPGLVIAALRYGGTPSLYRSTDGGATWSLSRRATFEEFLCVVFAADGTPYAGSSQGIYEGNFDGTTWLPIGYPYQSRISSIAFHPNRPNEMWAGGSTGQTSPLARSTDRGRTWQAVPLPGNPYRTISRILFDPANSNKMYVTIADYGLGPTVWFSGDGGTSWIARSNSLPQFPMNDLVHDGTLLWACGGQQFANQGVGVWRSANEGVSWQRMSNFSWPTTVINDLELDPAHPGTIFAATDRGVFRTTNNGSSWSFGIGATAGYYMNVVRIVPGTGTILAGVESYGVQSSTNGGNTFTASSSGMHAIGITCLAAHPTDPLQIAVGFAGYNTGGLATSRDRGVTWTTELVPHSRWLRVLYTDDGTLYGLTGGPSDVTGEGVYRRNPNGSWTKLGPDLGPQMEIHFSSLHVSSSNPNQILAGGLHYASFNYSAGIWRSVDGGQTWSKRYSGQTITYVWDLESADDGQDRIMLGTTNRALLRSTDGGMAWSTITDGLPTFVKPRQLSRSSIDRAQFYMTAEYPSNGLYRSTDAGLSWSPLPGTNSPTGGTNPADVVCDPSDPQVLYITPGPTQHSRVMRSEDGGQTFALFDQGLDGWTGFAFAVTASPCTELLLATGSGVMRRTIDRTPPQLSIGIEPLILWPPNHHRVRVHVTVDLHDNCGNATFALTSITADEPLAAGDIEGADFGTPDVDFELRAERPGSDDGRHYFVTYTAADASGNTQTATVEVFVPHDQGGGLGPEATANADPRWSTSLAPIAPNPFEHDAEIAFTLSRAQRVEAEVFDARGALLLRLASGERAAGSHRLSWDGRDASGGLAPSGIYLIRLTTAEGQWMRRAALVR